MSYLERSDLRLHYQLLEPKPSQGITLIFLHGLIMDNLSSWFFTLAHPAAQRARTLLYDLRGHGMSARPAKDYSIDHHLADLEALVEHCAPDDALILIGNSFGGLLALNFASRHPERMAGLILVDAQINDESWRVDLLSSLRLEGEDREMKIAENFKNWLGRHSQRKSNKLAQHAQSLLQETTLLDDLEHSAYFSDEDLARISCPVSALYGEHSPIVAHAARLKQGLADCEVHIFEGCTHSLLWEQTAKLESLVLRSIEAMIERDSCKEKLVYAEHQPEESRL